MDTVVAVAVVIAVVVTLLLPDPAELVLVLELLVGAETDVVDVFIGLAELS